MLHSLPPAALVSAKEMALDPRAEPAYAERVPYIVVHGAPGSRLIDLVVSPREFISGKSEYAINYQYYIHKQVSVCWSIIL
jgi:DNA polymerase zeta